MNALVASMSRIPAIVVNRGSQQRAHFSSAKVVRIGVYGTFSGLGGLSLAFSFFYYYSKTSFFFLFIRAPLYTSFPRSVSVLECALSL